MEPRGFTGKLAQFSARHSWTVIITWIVLFLVIGSLTAIIPASMTSEARSAQEPESLKGQNLIDSRFNGSADSPNELVVVKSSGETIDDPAFQSFVETLRTDLTASAGDHEIAIPTFYETGNEAFVSDDQQAMILPVFMSDEDGEDFISSFMGVIEDANGTDGFTVATGGEDSTNYVFGHSAEEDLISGEAVGISVALIVLVIVFGTLVSSAIPLGLAITSIAIATGLVNIIGHQWELSLFVTNMVTMIGLAVGIDYSLFIIGRYREERNQGQEPAAAVIRASDTATKAVVFSGITVVIALLGMLLVPNSIFRSLGIGAIIVVLVSVAATLTLLPAVLTRLAGKVSRGTGRTLTGFLSVFLLLFAAAFMAMGISIVFPIAYVVLAVIGIVLTVLNIDPFRDRTGNGEGAFWDRITRFVLRRPWALVSTAVAVMLAISSIYFTINLGMSGISALPHDSTTHTAFTLLNSEFSGISLEDPHSVVIDVPDLQSAETQAAIDKLIAEAANDEAFGPAQVVTNEQGDLAVIRMASTFDSQSEEALDAVERMRNDYVPAAFGANADDVYVAGPSAQTVDFNALVDTYTPVVFIFVLGMSLLLLLLAFRSVVVPVTSVIFNLLSIGMAYGLLVAVFQHGWGNEIFGFRQVEHIDAWIPLLMFSILFGLSMDYHVFLLSRIKEHFDMTGDNTESVAYGLRTTASIITGAALIMVAVFGGFAMGELPMFQQIGFGLATAVLLDATIVRSVLVPASMKLLGNANWYFPSWLGWLPKINVEGAVEEVGPEPDLEPQPQGQPAFE